MLKFARFLLLIGLVGVFHNALACELTGYYVLNWYETHGQVSRPDLPVEIAKAGIEPRSVLGGVQAISANDCLVNSHGVPSAYLLAFKKEQYLALGWADMYVSGQLICYWGSNFLICRNLSKRTLYFDCPSSGDTFGLPHEAGLICSIRQTEKEYFEKKRVVFASNMNNFGAASGVGLFKLERFKNE